MKAEQTALYVTHMYGLKGTTVTEVDLQSPEAQCAEPWTQCFSGLHLV